MIDLRFVPLEKWPTTPTDGLAFVSLHSGIQPQDPDQFERAYRAAAKKLHPDNPQTGNRGQWIMLQQAKESVTKELGW